MNISEISKLKTVTSSSTRKLVLDELILRMNSADLKDFFKKADGVEKTAQSAVGKSNAKQHPLKAIIRRHLNDSDFALENLDLMKRFQKWYEKDKVGTLKEMFNIWAEKMQKAKAVIEIPKAAANAKTSAESQAKMAQNCLDKVVQNLTNDKSKTPQEKSSTVYEVIQNMTKIFGAKNLPSELESSKEVLVKLASEGQQAEKSIGYEITKPDAQSKIAKEFESQSASIKGN